MVAIPCNDIIACSFALLDFIVPKHWAQIKVVKKLGMCELCAI